MSPTEMPAMATAELIQAANESSERSDRDQLFRRLVRDSGVDPDSVFEVIRMTSGVWERSDRVQTLGAICKDEVKTIGVMERVALHDPSGLVRVEATRWIERQGQSAGATLLRLLDASLERGERPSWAPFVDTISLILRGLCELGGPVLSDLMARVIRGVPASVTNRFIEILLEKGDILELESLNAIAFAATGEVSNALMSFRLLFAKAILDHNAGTNTMLVSFALRAPTTRLQIQALDALHRPNPSEAGLLSEMVRRDDSPLARAACRAWGRTGEEFIARLRSLANEALPKPSAGWWALVEEDPAWCLTQLETSNLSSGSALLPGREEQPAGSGLLYGVARSSLDTRLRWAATSRLLTMDSAGHRHRAALWLWALQRVHAPPGVESAADRELAHRSLDSLERRVSPTPSLRMAAAAVAPQMAPDDLWRVACAIASVVASDGSESSTAFVGILYDTNPLERLRAVIGLCQSPIGSVTETLLHRGLNESIPLLRDWTLAAAWSAWRSALKAPATGTLLERLVSANSVLAEALRPSEEFLLDARDAQLAEWLALPVETRVNALIEHSRSHPGRKLTRVQARDLSRALTRPGRARHIVGLLMNDTKPGGLARALRLARRSGAGRSHKQERIAADLARTFPYESSIPSDRSVGTNPSEETDEGGHEPEEPGTDGADESPPRPSPDHSRVVSSIRPDIARLLATMEFLADADQTAPQRPGVPERPLLGMIPHETLIALRRQLLDSLLPRWQSIFPGATSLVWPDTTPIVLTTPLVLHALRISRDATALQKEGANDLHALGACFSQALSKVLVRPPPSGPELDFLAQVLSTFGESFPKQMSRLVSQQATHHPDWRPLVFGAWLADPGRLRRRVRQRPAARALEIQERVSRSLLAQHLSLRVEPLAEVDFETRNRRAGRAWAQMQGSSGFTPSVIDLPPLALVTPDPTDVAPVLATGAWSTQGMDYPDFHVTARRDFSLTLMGQEAQQRIGSSLAVPSMLRRIAMWGRPIDLLQLAWSKDCVVLHDMAMPIADDPLEDVELADRHFSWAPSALPAALEAEHAHSSQAHRPAAREELTGEELDALPLSEGRSIAYGMPAQTRRFAGAVISAMAPTTSFASGQREDGQGASVGGPPSWWRSEVHDSVTNQVVADARAYIVLRAERPGRARIPRKTLRRFWHRKESRNTPSLQLLRDAHGADRLIEGLIQGLLVHILDRAPTSSTDSASDKQVTVRTLRQIALAWNFTEPSFLCEEERVHTDEQNADEPEFAAEWMSEAQAHQALRVLHGVAFQAPREVGVALGFSDVDGLPRLLGGSHTLLERTIRHVLSDLAPRLTGPRTDDDLPATTFHCRPLPKSEAVQRGDLGGDCSSGSVPFRCMSPHHTYYGVFLDGVQQRGYLTLFEAWLQRPDGEMVPSLVLETINIPIPMFDCIQLDLVHIIEAIAHHRGLSKRIGIVTSWWAWNYANGRALLNARASRQGTKTTLTPADPWCWSVYETLMPFEAGTFSPFRSSSSATLLAQTTPTKDWLQPENVTEALRIRALGRKDLIPTAWEGAEIRGFISSLPTTH